MLGANGERVHARGVLDPAQQAMGFSASGKVYTDPKTQELLGIHADDIGTAHWVMAGDLTNFCRTTGHPGSAPWATACCAEPPVALASLEGPQAAPFIEGRIIDVPKGVTQIGVLDAAP